MSALPPRPRSRRRVFALVTAAMCALLTVAGSTVTAPAASAATQGAGFGTWAPRSMLGWHGSMAIGGLHTYCVLPGLPVPTGDSVDHGVIADGTGLTRQQLTGINRLVSLYGQSGDPVQSAATGWAVKAIANLEHTVHAWGYTGDSLSGVIHAVFDRLAPVHATTVAALAEQYYAEAAAVTVPGEDGQVHISTDAVDPRRGSVRIDGGLGTSVTVTLSNAIFADSGSAELTDPPRGIDLPILTTAPDASGDPYTAQAAARFTAPFAPVVHFFTTPGGQSTAGPGGGVDYTVQATDAAPRPVLFAPAISTHALDPAAGAGRYVDEVSVASLSGVWPRMRTGERVPLRATATVYRTEDAPAASDAVPSEATAVGTMELVTDPDVGEATYRVAADWDLPGPGYYTAVWKIAASEQDAAVAEHLEDDYVWAESFATPAQIVHVPSPPMRDEEEAAVAALSAAVPATLAATGTTSDTVRIAGAGLICLLLGGGLLGHHAQREDRRARPVRARP